MYLRHGTYYFVDLSGIWHRLGRELRDALRAYADHVALPQSITLGSHMDRYVREVIPTKAKRTQDDNHTEMENLRAVFGHMLPDEIRPSDIYAYVDARGAPTRARRERSLLSHLYTKLIEWGVVESNPCREVRLGGEKPRERYVTDKEFWAVHDQAPRVLQLVMEFIVMTGLRPGTVLALRREQLTVDGILVPRVKRGRPLLIERTPDLKAVTDELLRLREIKSVYVICNRDGQRYTYSGFDAMRKRAVAKALAAGTLKQSWSLHDLRRKTGSEAEDDELLGHMDERTLRRHYQVAPRRVRPHRIAR